VSEEPHQHLPATGPVPDRDAAEISFRAIAWFVLAFALSLAVIVIGLWWLEKPFIRGNFSESRPIRTLDVDQPLQPSPGHPQLPWEDLASRRHEQLAALNAYGPLNGDPSRSRIPISRAMDLLLQSGNLNKPWVAPTTMPYKIETQPSPYATPTIRNRT